MKTNILFLIVLVLIRFEKSNPQRRIIDGKEIKNSKRYMVYLVKAPISPNQYDEWICGGAIVNPIFIVTSAACVEDIQYMYAVAGYKKYVPSHKLNDDPCTKEARKKVVFTCVPKAYDLDYSAVANWSFIDIAAVRVESAYNFEAPSPIPYCSWVPDMIEINYDDRYAKEGLDSLVYGWGHQKIWRKVEDTRDYNQETLQWGSTVIIDKNICKNSYSKVDGILPAIDKYMICTDGEGAIDDEGRQIDKPVIIPRDGCVPSSNGSDAACNPLAPQPLMSQSLMSQSLMSQPGLFNVFNESSLFNNFNLRSDVGNGLNYFNYIRRKLAEDNTTNKAPHSTRRNGICQNDHGGPLVTWMGASEILLGIASVFLVQPGVTRTCEGPFLFTSTHCNSAFLTCVLTMFDDKNDTKKETKLRSDDRVSMDKPRFLTPEQQMEKEKRDDIVRRYETRGLLNRGMCDLPPEKRGFDLMARRISWIQHPDGPAANELEEDLLERPQIPLNMFHSNLGEK